MYDLSKLLIAYTVPSFEHAFKLLCHTGSCISGIICLMNRLNIHVTDICTCTSKTLKVMCQDVWMGLTSVTFCSRGRV